MSFIETLKERVWVGNYREIGLMVRVHSKTIPNGTMLVTVNNELWCPEDPALHFVNPTAIASVSISANAPTVSPIPPGGSTVPALGFNSATGFGSHVRVILTVSAGTPAANLYADLSIALICKGW